MNRTSDCVYDDEYGLVLMDNDQGRRVGFDNDSLMTIPVSIPDGF